MVYGHSLDINKLIGPCTPTNPQSRMRRLMSTVNRVIVLLGLCIFGLASCDAPPATALKSTDAPASVAPSTAPVASEFTWLEMKRMIDADLAAKARVFDCTEDEWTKTV